MLFNEGLTGLEDRVVLNGVDYPEARASHNIQHPGPGTPSPRKTGSHCDNGIFANTPHK